MEQKQSIKVQDVLSGWAQGAKMRVGKGGHGGIHNPDLLEFRV
jgi:hypothetical protein